MRSLIFILLVALLAVPASAGSLSGVKMNDTISVDGDTLRLNGMALRKKLFIKVYVAGLYLPSAQSDGAKVLASDTSRQVVLHFVRGVDKGSMCGAWDEALAANTPDASAETKTAFKTLCDWMDDVDNGDQMVFTYVPNSGTMVEVGGAKKGSLPGKAFADALFAAWIGETPGPGEAFKADLLGN